MKPVTRVLTPAAQDDADDFYIRFADRGCSCHISPPCSHCVHPGNPLNLECDDAAWIEVAAVTQSRKIREGRYAGKFNGHHRHGWRYPDYRTRRTTAAIKRGLADKPGEA